jgi:hypothetical protein
MNMNDEFSGDEKCDPLADTLRRQAMAERPAFSEELHHRIMDSAKQPSGLGGRRSLLAIAASVILAAGIWAASQFMQSPPPAVVVANVSPNHAVAAVPASLDMSVDINGIVSAGFFPPQVHIDLPIPANSTEPESDDAPAANSPDYAIAGIQDPTSSAASALMDVMPQDFRLALDLLNR